MKRATTGVGFKEAISFILSIFSKYNNLSFQLQNIGACHKVQLGVFVVQQLYHFDWEKSRIESEYRAL